MCLFSSKFTGPLDVSDGQLSSVVVADNREGSAETSLSRLMIRIDHPVTPVTVTLTATITEYPDNASPVTRTRSVHVHVSRENILWK